MTKSKPDSLPRRQAGAARAMPHWYFVRVARARYVLRRVFRIVDEQARLNDLDPLAHQAMLQIYGSPEAVLQINQLADRLDASSAFASHIVTKLQRRGLVCRKENSPDRRITIVAITPEGRSLLSAIDRQAKIEVDAFMKKLSREDKEIARTIIMFYAAAARA